MDARLGYVILSGDPEVLSNGPPDRVLKDPVNSDGGMGRTSLQALGGAGGLLGGDEVSGSRVRLPVSNSAPRPLFWLVALPDVFGRSLVVRSKSDCRSVVEKSPLFLMF
jgi:hypothetical protein